MANIHPPRPRDVARRTAGILGIVSMILGLVLAFSSAAASAAPKKTRLDNFAPAQSGATYSTDAALNPSCNGIFGTPGSFPAGKAIDSVDGNTIHYVFHDNPARTDPDFQIQDCVLAYPADFFVASDFDSNGVLVSASYSKHDLSGGDVVDKADLSGTTDSTDNIFYDWTVPDTVGVGTWICNFARDVNDQHQGEGNRKAVPACFQVQGQDREVTPATPAPVTFHQPCGTANYYTVPTAPEGLEYTLLGDSTAIAPGNYDLAAGDDVTIVAHALEGYELTAGSWSWSFTGAAITSCGGGIVIVPEVPTTVLPTTTTTVSPTTTTTAPELALTEEPTTTTTATPPTTEAPVLAFTGAGTGKAALAGLALIAIGGVCVAFSRRRSIIE